MGRTRSKFQGLVLEAQERQGTLEAFEGRVMSHQMDGLDHRMAFRAALKDVPVREDTKLEMAKEKREALVVTRAKLGREALKLPKPEAVHLGIQLLDWIYSNMPLNHHPKSGASGDDVLLRHCRANREYFYTKVFFPTFMAKHGVKAVVAAPGVEEVADPAMQAVLEALANERKRQQDKRVLPSGTEGAGGEP